MAFPTNANAPRLGTIIIGRKRGRKETTPTFGRMC
jgi:hypothetical protein